VRVEDTGHVALRHLGESFEIEDEIYQFKEPYDRARMRVLMSIDPASVDLARPEVHRTDRDFAITWTKPWGKGRVFYTALGHRPEVWKDERFQKLLEGGFAWAMRVEDRPKLSLQDAAYAAAASAGTGDPKRGFDVFRRESGPMCARCHAVNGTRPAGGTEIGPDLSGIARRFAPEEIVDAILAPSASVDARYAAVSLELADGTFAFGRIVAEAEGRITLADTNGVPRTIATGDVRARNPSNVSVMPDGLARTLSREEFADLVAYVRTLTVPAVPAPK
jgi:putative heme-binding domain-containing protein